MPYEAAASRPATLPALKGELAEKWQAYRAVWQADDSKKLDAAGAALYGASGDRWQLESLSVEMERFYRAGEKSGADDGRLCRLAHIIFATRLRFFRGDSEPRLPRTPDEKAVGRFIAEYQAVRKRRARTALWGFRVLETAVGNIPDPRRKNDALLRAWYVMESVSFFCMPFVDDPGRITARFKEIEPKLATAADEDPAKKAVRRQKLKNSREMLTLLSARAEAKQAIATALSKFRTAYNAKDDAAFAEVATRKSRKVLSARSTKRWTISLLRPYAIRVREDSARIKLFIRYNDKSGKPGPIRQETFRASKTGGHWRLAG